MSVDLIKVVVVEGVGTQRRIPNPASVAIHSRKALPLIPLAFGNGQLGKSALDPAYVEGQVWSSPETQSARHLGCRTPPETFP